MIGKAAALLALGTITSFLLASPASAAPTSTISVYPSSVAVGSSISITGTIPLDSCPVEDDVTITGNSALFPPDGTGPTVPRDPTGSFEVQYTVPASIRPGVYSIGMRCGGGNVGATTTLKVTAASPTPSVSPSESSSPTSTPSVVPTTSLAPQGDGISNSDLHWLLAGVLLFVVVVVGVWLGIKLIRR